MRKNGLTGQFLRVTASSVLLTTLALAGGLLVAQTQPALQISSPASGTVVSPGQTLSVSVTSPAGISFSQVDVIGEYPIGMSTIATAVPAQFSLAIPLRVGCGQHWLTAEGTTVSGQNFESVSIMIDVERPDLPAGLSSATSRLFLESQGEQTSLDINAIFIDRTILRVTESSYLTFSSSNPAVATVDSLGNVTAVGAGSALVSVIYSAGGDRIQIGIPVTVQNPMINVAPRSLSFGSQPVGTSSAAQQLALTNASSGNLSILDVKAKGDFSEADNCLTSSPLTVGNGCSVNVTFSPSAAGSRTGSIVITNDANVVPITIAVNGTGTVTPNISGLSPTSGTAGTSVTITGVNFGAMQGTSTVTFNGVLATPTTWSATSIVAPVPSGATTGSVVVTVGGVASNGVSFTVGNPPVAYVQGNSATQPTISTTATATYTATQAAGNLNVVVVAWGDSSPQVLSVTDTKGNIYAVAVGPTTQTYCQSVTQTQAIYYAKNIGSAAAGANTVTVTFTAHLGSATVRIAEYSGLDVVHSVDVSVANFGSTSHTTLSSGSVTTTNAHDLLIGADLSDVGTAAPGTGYTSRILNKDLLEDMSVTVTGSYSATATLNAPSSGCSGSAHYIMQMVAFRAAN